LIEKQMHNISRIISPALFLSGELSAN